MTAYLLTFGCIFAVNLLPAFGPPTWALLVFFKLQYDLPIVPMVLGGALCAASGRLALAHGSRRFRHRLSAERREHLNAAAEVLAADRRRSAGALGLFALSPVPSAQLFVAAGLLDLRLLRLTAAFFAGRLVSYAVYVSGATLAHSSLGAVLGRAFGSPVGIALQIAMLVGLIALLRIDWTSRLARYRPDLPSTGKAPTFHAPLGRRKDRLVVDHARLRRHPVVVAAEEEEDRQLQRGHEIVQIQPRGFRPQCIQREPEAAHRAGQLEQR